MKRFQSEDNDETEEGRIYSMAYPLSRFECYEEQIDVNINDAVNNELNDKLCDVEKRKQLFVNCRFWLNREVPKDPLAIIIRFTFPILINVLYFFSSTKHSVISFK